MILPALLLAAAPAPLSLNPFRDEGKNGDALDAHLACLGSATFDRRDDKREAKLVALDVVEACSAQASALRAALTDIYRRKPQLIPAGKTPKEAADAYVNEMNGRVELVILGQRKPK